MLHNQLHKKAIALALALGAILPATATAARPADSGGESLTMPQNPAVRIITPASGFDWGDAGIGAAGGLALATLGVGGGLLVSHHRPRPTRNTTSVPS